MPSVTKTLDLGELGEHDVEVHFDATPGRPGCQYLPNGDPGYPDEPAECTLNEVFWGGYNILHHIPPDIIAHWQTEILDDAAEQPDEQPEKEF